MKGASSSAPDPDPNIGIAALKQAETGEAWLGFAKDAFKVSTKRQEELDALTNKVTDMQLGIAGQQKNQAKQQFAWAKQDRNRYENTFLPAENKFIKEAMNYGSEARQNEAAASAVSDIRQQTQVQRAAAERTAQAQGIAPGSGRYAGIEKSADLTTALGSAGAANDARTAVRDKGLALKADVANLGRGLPAQSASATSLGLGAASGAVGSGGAALGGAQATNAQSMAATDIMGSGYRGAMAGYAGEASTLNQQYGLQLDAWKAEQQVAAQNAAGIGQAIGGIAGLFFSDENLKENKAEIPEGRALDALDSMRVEEWDYKQGVADGGRHVGTYAQDFAEATGHGDGRTIAAQDAIGITMKAVQDLNKKVDRVADAIGLGQTKKKAA